MNKSISFLSLLGVLVLLSAFSSDNCEGYFPYKEGTRLEYTSYDKEGKMIMTLQEKKSTDAGLEITMATEIVDEKNKEALNGSFGIRCEGDKFYFDMSNMIPAEMMESMGEMDMEITSDYLEFPANAVAGKTLPDGTMTIKAGLNGVNVMNMTVLVTDRRIDGFEQVTTPAGTFDCMKYSFTTTTKMMFTVTSSSTTWLAKEVGNVKTENYDNKGRLESSSVLTAASF